MELKNIAQAQKLFPDAVKLQLRINGNMTVDQVRRLLPSSVVLLSCKLSKNYANVIYSEGAAKRLFPDITTIRKEIELGGGKKAYVYGTLNHTDFKLLVNFLPTSEKLFIGRLEMAFGKKLVQVSNYPEVNMGCFFFEETHLEDLVGVLTLCIENGEAQ